MNQIEVSLGRQFIEVSCHDCVLTVESGEPDFPFVEVRLLRTHAPSGGWRYQLREAWRVLRGEGAEWWEFYSRDEIDRFIAALERAKPTLPTPIPNTPCTANSRQSESQP